MYVCVCLFASLVSRSAEFALHRVTNLFMTMLVQIDLMEWYRLAVWDACAFLCRSLLCCF